MSYRHLLRSAFNVNRSDVRSCKKHSLTVPYGFTFYIYILVSDTLLDTKNKKTVNCYNIVVNYVYKPDNTVAPKQYNPQERYPYIYTTLRGHLSIHGVKLLMGNLRYRNLRYRKLLVGNHGTGVYPQGV